MVEIETIELPPGQYKINGEMQDVQHFFMIERTPQDTSPKGQGDVAHCKRWLQENPSSLPLCNEYRELIFAGLDALAPPQPTSPKGQGDLIIAVSRGTGDESYQNISDELMFDDFLNNARTFESRIVKSPPQPPEKADTGILTMLGWMYDYAQSVLDNIKTPSDSSVDMAYDSTEEIMKLINKCIHTIEDKYSEVAHPDKVDAIEGRIGFLRQAAIEEAPEQSPLDERSLETFRKFMEEWNGEKPSLTLRYDGKISALWRMKNAVEFTLIFHGRNFVCGDAARMDEVGHGET